MVTEQGSNVVIMNVSETANFLRCSERYVRILVHREDETRIPHYRLGSRILFNQDELIEYLNSTRSCGRA